ncbi:MAG TPA: DUF2059 domain-containing protein [Longimicrobium sp.]|nr:DUF2059 domain-containing protein [Longimicrobium sp.]
MKKVIALVACAAAFALARPARAQDEPTPARTAAAEQLIASIDMEHTYAKTMEMMVQSQLRQNPQMAQFEGVMRSFFARYLSWPQIHADMARIYALTYTEDEMRQLTAFYQTPLGKRLLETMPELAQRSSEVTQRRVMEHMPELMEQMMGAMQGGGSTPAPRP